MTVVRVAIAAGLRDLVGGGSSVDVEVGEPVTLGAVLEALSASHPAIGRRVRDESGAVRRHVKVFVGADEARHLDGLDTVVGRGVEVSVMAAVSGG